MRPGDGARNQHARGGLQSDATLNAKVWPPWSECGSGGREGREAPR